MYVFDFWGLVILLFLLLKSCKYCYHFFLKFESPCHFYTSTKCTVNLLIFTSRFKLIHYFIKVVKLNGTEYIECHVTLLK